MSMLHAQFADLYVSVKQGHPFVQCRAAEFLGECRVSGFDVALSEAER